MVPIFWGSFLGLFTIASWNGSIPPLWQGFPLLAYKGLLTLFYLGTIGILYMAFGGLKRVEVNESYVYVTNYFKTVRYQWDAVDHIETSGRTGVLELKEAGTFGKRIRFIVSLARVRRFKEAIPDLAQKITTS